MARALANASTGGSPAPQLRAQGSWERLGAALGEPQASPMGSRLHPWCWPVCPPGSGTPGQLIPEQHPQLGRGQSGDVMVAPRTLRWAGTRGGYPVAGAQAGAGARSLHFAAVLGASADPLGRRDGQLPRCEGSWLQGPSAAPKSSLSIQTRLPSTGRAMPVAMQHRPEKAVTLGSSGLISPFTTQTFQKSTFGEKIFLIALFATT